MEQQYQFIFGVFDAPDTPREPDIKRVRVFSPVISETMTRQEAIKRLKILEPTWPASKFGQWIHREDRPRTFKLDEFYGYRIIEVDRPNLITSPHFTEIT
jgi:hypothetical protein